MMHILKFKKIVKLNHLLIYYLTEYFGFSAAAVRAIGTIAVPIIIYIIIDLGPRFKELTQTQKKSTIAKIVASEIGIKLIGIGVGQHINSDLIQLDGFWGVCVVNFIH